MTDFLKLFLSSNKKYKYICLKQLEARNSLLVTVDKKYNASTANHPALHAKAATNDNFRNNQQ